MTRKRLAPKDEIENMKEEIRLLKKEVDMKDKEIKYLKTATRTLQGSSKVRRPARQLIRWDFKEHPESLDFLNNDDCSNGYYSVISQPIEIEGTNENIQIQGSKRKRNCTICLKRNKPSKNTLLVLHWNVSLVNDIYEKDLLGFATTTFIYRNEDLHEEIDDEDFHEVEAPLEDIKNAAYIEMEVEVLKCDSECYADFTESGGRFEHDAVIEVDGMNFHINMFILRVASDFFRGYFTHSQPNDDGVFELHKNVPHDHPMYCKAETFENFLRAIYPEKKEVTTDNVKDLIHLADQFCATKLKEDCEALLLKESEHFQDDFLYLMACRYSLPFLQIRLLQWSPEPLGLLKDALKHDDFKKLTIEMRNDIEKKFINLSVFGCP